LPEPIYTPKEIFEQKLIPGNSGCEDPRITQMDDRLYVFYAAFDGYTPRVTFTSILTTDFLNKNWNWDRSKVISSPLIHDKDSCLLAKKINNKYAIFHRAHNDIYLDYVNDLKFKENEWLKNNLCLIHTNGCIDESNCVEKVGISAPPIETKYGWLLIYHWVSRSKQAIIYKVGAALLDLQDPSKVLKKDIF
jgi:Predicted glycosylase